MTFSADGTARHNKPFQILQHAGEITHEDFHHPNSWTFYTSKLKTLRKAGSVGQYCRRGYEVKWMVMYHSETTSSEQSAEQSVKTPTWILSGKCISHQLFQSHSHDHRDVRTQRWKSITVQTPIPCGVRIFLYWNPSIKKTKQNKWSSSGKNRAIQGTLIQGEE